MACLLVFAFAFVREGRALEDAAAGILWVSVAFSGTLALGRAFEHLIPCMVRGDGSGEVEHF